ncbi:MAG: riboflavin biosynthesis protein RibD [Gammaproteobacteria bacterium 39-13]|nr:bifunctional diaminohydroxyphosphoribosylaminopyrimidine deaminase/5-amino-6-(5-phosphoribosylamino)uracil reductase RibD [Gammaproteobacteria bacterium]OJV88372.1 MAG: riboflavin biosynthesis protein RibD [Gammaproteobacteria bacterium 39-13]
MKAAPSNIDFDFMRQALALAALGQYTAHPNPRVGCILVKEGHIVGQGCHWQTGCAHAEVNALQDAKGEGVGATCYVTLEPCAHVGRTPPCIHALIEAKIKKVVIATLDPNPKVAGKGVRALEAAGIEVVVGVLQQEAQSLNKGFFSRMQRQRPYVRGKIGMSLDGRVAMANGESQWITSVDSRADVQYWRARSGAILTGSQTVKQDNCRLTVRQMKTLDLPEISFQQPLRVIVDSKLSISAQAEIFCQPGRTVVATTSTLCSSKQKEWINALPLAHRSQVECIALAEKENHVDLLALMHWLGEREINDVLVETGPTLMGALLQQGLIDELLLYIAPKLLGSEAKGMIHIPGISKLADHIAGAFAEMEQVGSDLRLVVKLSDFARTT